MSRYFCTEYIDFMFNNKILADFSKYWKIGEDGEKMVR